MLPMRYSGGGAWGVRARLWRSVVGFLELCGQFGNTKEEGEGRTTHSLTTRVVYAPPLPTDLMGLVHFYELPTFLQIILSFI